MTKFLKYIIAVSSCCLISGGTLTGGTSIKNIVASRVSISPKIDGFMDDDAWKQAVPVGGFQQFDPEEGLPATEETSVKIVYDDNALYVGVICYDTEPDKIVKQLTRRDRTVLADRFSVIIDSYNDQKTAFLFSGSVSGVQSDGILSQDGMAYDVQWDAVWDFDAKVTTDGWSAEFKIPYGAIRFADQDGEYVWGINFRRFIPRKQETDEWVMVPRKDTPTGTISSVSKMGNVSGIINIHPPLHIEMLPYHVSRINFLSHPTPFSVTKEYKPNIGLDVKYGITNNFTLDAAFNPDFGQVEVDRANLNLTVFETYYPEKRPFFLEGSQIFSFGNSFDNKPLRLLYSRRIGRQPTGYNYVDQYVSLSDTMIVGKNAMYSKKPEVTSILAAAKLTGQTEKGFELGVLTALTDREDAIIKNINGVTSPRLMVEPKASYNVIRLRQNNGNSSIGWMATGSFKQNNYPALSIGTDWQIRTDDRQYEVDGYLVSSIKKFDPLENYGGTAGRIAIGKVGGEHWLCYSGYDFSSKKFYINDLGYYSQPREHGGYTALTYKEDHANEPIRRYAITTETDYRWNWYGVKTLHAFELEPSIEFRNFWVLSFDYVYEFPAYDDYNQGMIGVYNRPTANNLTATIRTDTRQMINATFRTGMLHSSKGAHTSYATILTDIRPISWIEISPGYTFIRVRQEEAWVTSPNPPYYYYTEHGNLFGDRDIDQHDLSLRSTITFTKNLSLQFYTQVFLAKGRYRNFKVLRNENYLPAYDFEHDPYYTNPDFNEKTLNANIVLRWEYVPGSTFYFVWTQGRHGYRGVYEQNFSRDVRDAFQLPMDNVLLVKFSYWWSL